MKKTVLSMVLLVLVVCLIAKVQQPHRMGQPIEMPVGTPMEGANQPLRNAPNVDFIVDPVPIMTNYYDYFPGSYDNSPIFIQPEISQPFLYPAGGVYIAFQARETSAANRRVYFAYFNDQGQLIERSAVSGQNLWEGFPGITMDPVTGNPIITWHHSPAGQELNCWMNYDVFHLIGSHGAWHTPWIAMHNQDSYTNPDLIDQDLTPPQDPNEFIWPKLSIGPSPNAGQRRLYFVGSNSTSNFDGMPCGNVIIGIADIDDNTMMNFQDIEFEFQTIPELDYLNYEDIARTFQNLTVGDDGKVAMAGWHAHYGDEDDPADEDYFRFHYIHSDDYGQTFTYYDTDSAIPTWNPQNLDGSYVFNDPDNNNQPYPDEELFWTPSSISHFNAEFTQGSSNVIALAAMNISTASGYYYPYYTYPTIFDYSLVNDELVVDVQFLMYSATPWDLDEDGEVDEYYDTGEVYIPAYIPSHFYKEGDWVTVHFHEGNFKLTKLQNWIVAMWQDATNVYYSTIDDDYADWAATPQIAISISSDHGQTWSEPALMNARVGDENFYDQFNGMIPCYIYPANELVEIDGSTAKMHFFFTDDYSYGSSVQGDGQNIGSMVNYAVLSVEGFPTPVSSPNVQLPQADIATLYNNYPNPFNPETTIKFETKHAENVTVEVFNIKGQKVTTLVDDYLPAGTHEVQWSGRNNSNQPVASGIYFYRLRSGRYTSTKKMILMK